ncbi:MAG TPA: Na+/H+ antiporter NhaA [Actinomycetota bacterium]
MTAPKNPSPDHLRHTWSQSERAVPRTVVRPLLAFLQLEAAGGILLLVATVAALVWANSPWQSSYESFWHTRFTIRIGSWAIQEDLQHWINDALMALFFFVVGLEIKRELVGGELRDPRAAALPAIAALGGMIGPALIYAAFNAGGAGSAGWGIPMATDIAFAVGVLAIAGRRLPTSLKLFLLALAIVDDIGAILVIAIFYSGGVSMIALGVAAALLALIVVLQRLHVRSLPVYVIIGTGVWLAVFESGVHATIAGVALGLLTPAAAFQRRAAVVKAARDVATDADREEGEPDADAHHWLGLSRVSRDAISPLARLENMLHPWTSFLIVPLFALANAGVTLSGDTFGSLPSSRVALGVIAGLVVGKIVGISLFAWLATTFKVARLPAGARWSQVVSVAAVAGIGFTVSLFIAGLAFPTSALLDEAKIAILTGSLIAGVAGVAFLRISAGKSD